MNVVSPDILGVNVALVPLAYDAVRVTDCPDSTVAALAVKVQLGPLGVPDPSHEQSILHFPGVPLSAPSSQTSFGLIDRECHGKNVPHCVVIPQFPSVVPVDLSIVPSPHLAT